MINCYPHDRLVEERRLLLCKLERYEDSHNLDAWNECWSRLAEIDRILEVNP